MHPGEWADDLEPQELGHRHLSHLYGDFPGSRWTAAEPDEEVEASRAALSLRLAEGSGYTGWSQAWVLCLAARLRDWALAERAIATLLGPLSSHSLLDLHPLEGWPAAERSSRSTGTSARSPASPKLSAQAPRRGRHNLPALPGGWPSGKARGLRVRGGDAVDLEWRDRVLSSLVLHASATRGVTIDVPGDGPVRIRRGCRCAPARR